MVKISYMSDVRKRREREHQRERNQERREKGERLGL